MHYDILIIVIALALGGFVKGATGAGSPLVAVPVMASFFGVPFALAMMIVPAITSNTWQMWKFRDSRHGLAFVPWLLVTAAIGTAAGTWLLTELPANVLAIILGVVVVLYILLRLLRPHWHISRPAASRAAPTVGFVSGILLGATGISAPVSLTFLSSIRLTRPQFLFAVSTLFVVFTIVQGPALAVAGILTWERLLFSTLAMVPILLAMPAGNWIASRLSQKAFDRLILALLAVIAVKLFYDSGLFG